MGENSGLAGVSIAIRDEPQAHYNRPRHVVSKREGSEHRSCLIYSEFVPIYGHSHLEQVILPLEPFVDNEGTHGRFTLLVLAIGIT